MSIDLSKLVLVPGCWMLKDHAVARWVREEEGVNGYGLPMDTDAVLALVPLMQAGTFRTTPGGWLARSAVASLVAYGEPKGLRMLREALAAHDEAIGQLTAASEAVGVLRDLMRKRRDEWRGQCDTASRDDVAGLSGCVDAADALGGETFDLWMRLHRLSMALYDDRQTLNEAVAQWSRSLAVDLAPGIDPGAPFSGSFVAPAEVAK